MTRSNYHNRYHIISSEASLHEVMTAQPAFAEAPAGQRQRQLQTRIRTAALREERELATDRGWD